MADHISESVESWHNPEFFYQSWFSRLSQPQQALVKQSLELLDREKTHPSNWPDYSFVIFPFSKAYEGFLKDLLFELGLLSDKQYKGKRFRIGRALNPDLPERLRDEWWLYDDLAQICGQELAREIWQGWLECRNHVFHYFAADPKFLDLEQITKKIKLLISILQDIDRCLKQH